MVIAISGPIEKGMFERTDVKGIKKLFIDLVGDVDKLYLEFNGSPRKINIYPVKYMPKEVTIVSAGAWGFRMPKEEIDIVEGHTRVGIAGIGDSERRTVTYQLNLLSEAREVTVRALGIVKNMVLRVCKSVKEVVIRLFGRVKQLILGGFDAFRTRINFRHYVKGRTRKTIITLLKIAAAVVTTASVAFKLHELLRNFGLARFTSDTHSLSFP